MGAGWAPGDTGHIGRRPAPGAKSAREPPRPRPSRPPPASRLPVGRCATESFHVRRLPGSLPLARISLRESTWTKGACPASRASRIFHTPQAILRRTGSLGRICLVPRPTDQWRFDELRICHDPASSGRSQGFTAALKEMSEVLHAPEGRPQRGQAPSSTKSWRIATEHSLRLGSATRPRKSPGARR